MEEPVIAAKTPIKMTPEPGTYFWCRCGRSKTQPFCDGSHEGTAFTPVEVIITKQDRVAFCCCKRTKTPPFCDGTHRSL